MSDQGTMNGAEWLARALASTGMTHVFFIESVLRRTLLHLSDLGVEHILAHSEKAAAILIRTRQEKKGAAAAEFALCPA